jgi:transcriptional regulator with XRE-family HTH domain
MEEKINFGKYILQKRKEAGLSQKALAEKLFVSESAVSKWERGLSYPDITLLSSLCETLHISEHELLTASDDIHQKEIEAQSRGYLRIIKTYSWITYLCYLAALIPTFIWGLATHNGLSTFFILAAALLMVFSVVNLPVLTRYKRAHKCFWSFYGSLILLLIVCRLANVEAESEHWLIMSILGTSLGILGVFLPILLQTSDIKHPIMRQKGLICMGLDTVLIYLLVFFGSLFYITDTTNMIIAKNLIATTLFAIPAWGIFALFRYTPLNNLIKSFITVELCGIFLYFANSITDRIINGTTWAMPTVNFHNWGDYCNENIGVIIMVCAVVLLVIALIRKPGKR